MLARIFLLCLLLLSGVIFTMLAPLGLAIGLCLFGLVYWFLLNLYPDKFLLHYLQARETIETDHPEAYRIARSQCFKLKIQPPRIYTYSGFFNRSFALSARDRLVFVIERKTLETASKEDFEAIFFGLSLKASLGIAKQHTLGLLVMSLIWAPFLKLLSFFKFPNTLMSWGIQFFVAPIANTAYRLVLGAKTWDKFLKTLQKYKWEYARLLELNQKLDQPHLWSNPARELNFRFYSAGHTPTQQMILAIEGASHPLDRLKVESEGMVHA